MRVTRSIKPVLRIACIVCAVYVLFVLVVYFRQRSMLFFPSHRPGSGSLAPWTEGDWVIGYCREAPNPETIWLMMHGNAGQAADRDYVLRCMSEQDAFYVLEYPGYGSRPGSPSLVSINAAAVQAYRLLRSRHPRTAVCVLGESIGSGPACVLAREPTPPDKLVLIVPFDTLTKVAARHFPFLPVLFMLKDAWDNLEALRSYRGPVEVYAAQDDTIIPIDHARALAASIPAARLITIRGGHNDWSEDPQVRIRR
jgi:uncharacterized protein